MPSTPGGPKLVGVDLTDNTIFTTILFPPTVAYPDSVSLFFLSPPLPSPLSPFPSPPPYFSSFPYPLLLITSRLTRLYPQYLNDIRFDLRPHLTPSGLGVAYITDSSTEGRNGLITLDLGTGHSWRHLDGHPAVRPQQQVVPYVWGEAVYSIPGPGLPISYISFGADGIALSADGETLYWSAVGARYLYSIPTARLRDHSQFSEILAQSSIANHGTKGISDGLETDSNGLIYGGNVEAESIAVFSPQNGTFSTFVRDPRIGWTDTLSVGTDGYLYFTENQLWRSKSFYPGTDRRERPYKLFRVKLPDGGRKVLLA